MQKNSNCFWESINGKIELICQAPSNQNPFFEEFQQSQNGHSQKGNINPTENLNQDIEPQSQRAPKEVLALSQNPNGYLPLQIEMVDNFMLDQVESRFYSMFESELPSFKVQINQKLIQNLKPTDLLIVEVLLCSIQNSLQGSAYSIRINQNSIYGSTKKKYIASKELLFSNLRFNSIAQTQNLSLVVISYVQNQTKNYKQVLLSKTINFVEESRLFFIPDKKSLQPYFQMFDINALEKRQKNEKKIGFGQALSSKSQKIKNLLYFLAKYPQSVDFYVRSDHSTGYIGTFQHKKYVLSSYILHIIKDIQQDQQSLDQNAQAGYSGNFICNRLSPESKLILHFKGKNIPKFCLKKQLLNNISIIVSDRQLNLNYPQLHSTQIKAFYDYLKEVAEKQDIQLDNKNKASPLIPKKKRTKDDDDFDSEDLDQQDQDQEQQFDVSQDESEQFDRPRGRGRKPKYNKKGKKISYRNHNITDNKSSGYRKYHLKQKKNDYDQKLLNQKRMEQWQQYQQNMYIGQMQGQMQQKLMQNMNQKGQNITQKQKGFNLQSKGQMNPMMNPMMNQMMMRQMMNPMMNQMMNPMMNPMLNPMMNHMRNPISSENSKISQKNSTPQNNQNRNQPPTNKNQTQQIISQKNSYKETSQSPHVTSEVIEQNKSNIIEPLGSRQLKRPQQINEEKAPNTQHMNMRYPYMAQNPNWFHYMNMMTQNKNKDMGKGLNPYIPFQNMQQMQQCFKSKSNSQNGNSQYNSGAQSYHKVQQMSNQGQNNSPRIMDLTIDISKLKRGVTSRSRQ